MSDVDSGQVSLQPPKRKSSKKTNLAEPLVITESTPLDINTDPLELEVDAVEPEQEVREKWEYKPRQHQRWGIVQKEGLIVGRGDKKKIIPPDEVWKLASIGCTDEEISSWYGIDRQTLKYNFLDYMTKGRMELKQRLRNAQLKYAIAGNATMLIWLGKNMLGQSDNPTNTDSNQPLPWNDN